MMRSELAHWQETPPYRSQSPIVSHSTTFEHGELVGLAEVEAGEITRLRFVKFLT